MLVVGGDAQLLAHARHRAQARAAQPLQHAQHQVRLKPQQRRRPVRPQSGRQGLAPLDALLGRPSRQPRCHRLPARIRTRERARRTCAQRLLQRALLTGRPAGSVRLVVGPLRLLRLLLLLLLLLLLPRLLELPPLRLARLLPPCLLLRRCRQPRLLLRLLGALPLHLLQVAPLLIRTALLLLGSPANGFLVIIVVRVIELDGRDQGGCSWGRGVAGAGHSAGIRF
jgi:hypothetical protein